EKPNTPGRSPKAAARSFANWSCVEAVIDEMLQIFAHSNLSHQLVLVTVHASELTNVGKNVLKTIGQLKSVNIVETVLNMTVHNQLGETKNFSTQMESIAETRLFTLFCGQSFDGFQVKVV